MQAAVLGHPVSHSRSPALHNAAYRALGLADWTYRAIDCDRAQLADLLTGAVDGWAGFSVTMPLKHAALQAATEVRPAAELAGAANTLLPGPSGWVADNTDPDGVIGALRDAAIVATDGPVVLLGAGGAAQAAVVALARLGVTDLTVLVRNASRAGDLLVTAGRCSVRTTVSALNDAEALRGAGLVISSLPAGAADPVAGAAFRADQALLDMVYDPWPTALAAAFLQAGGRVAHGLDMLLHQALRQVELMTGRTPPIAAMRAALTD
ncbi:MAG: shikimate dehydrogenase [Jatrophihabitans sp.]